MEKQESIRNLKGIGEKTEKLFHILGIDTIQDLLDYYPREYEQYRIPVSVSMVRAGEKIAVLGEICASQVWRALYLEDPRIFEKREEVSDAGFSVDILIDASSSRKDSQEQIAAQSYILVKSLDLCRIPLQVYSYCSIRGYTVLRLFQSYGEIDRAEEVFSYVAAGNNRDGLALRGAGHLMENSEQEKKLLLVLTDGSQIGRASCRERV